MARFRKNATELHRQCLTAIYRLTNATAWAVCAAVGRENVDYVRRYINDLVADGLLVGKLIHAPTESGAVKMGTLFALTEQGAEALAATMGVELETVYYPKNGIQAKSPFMYTHRVGLVELCSQFLRLEQHNPGVVQVEQIQPYFRYEGSNRLGNGKALVRVTVNGTHIVPDAVVCLRIRDKRRLLVVELHRETQTKDVIEQLSQHADATDARAFSNRFGIDGPNFVLSVHTSETRLRKTVARIRAGEFTDFERFRPGYHFALLSEVLANGLDKTFYHLDGEPSRLFRTGD